MSANLETFSGLASLRPAARSDYQKSRQAFVQRIGVFKEAFRSFVKVCVLARPSSNNFFGQSKDAPGLRAAPWDSQRARQAFDRRLGTV
jgi:hypothetical protein